MPCLPPHLLLQILTILSRNLQGQWSEREDTHHHLQSGQRKGKLHFKTLTPLPTVTEIPVKRNLVEMIAVSNRVCMYSSSVTTNTMWEKCCTPCQKTSDRTSTAFLEQVPKQNIFRWDKEDFDTVQRKFVMEWDVPVASRNGRTQSMSNFASAEAIYHQWKSSSFFADTEHTETTDFLGSF